MFNWRFCGIDAGRGKRDGGTGSVHGMGGRGAKGSGSKERSRVHRWKEQAVVIQTVANTKIRIGGVVNTDG